MGSDACNECSETCASTALDIKVNTIQNSITEWPSGARATEKKVPYGVSKSFCLGIRRECRSARSASHAESDNLAPSLACLDVGSEELTVGQIGSGENASIGTADL
jgi:hypothetical protein